MPYQLAQALGVDVFHLLDPDTSLNLVTQRVRRGLLQSDVVDQGLSVGRADYGRVERGIARLGEEDRRRLAEILGLTTEQLEQSISGEETVGSLSGS